jgi:hypothetical protein
MLEGITPPQREAICRMMSAATQLLDDKDLKIFVEALNNPLWSAGALANAVTDRGFLVSTKQIQVHRRGSCPCLKI